MITYRHGNDLTPESIIELYSACSLGQRRPIDDAAIVADMIRHGNLTVSAWDGDLLVGVARTLTDFTYTGYMSDLAVRETHQRMGIGVELIRRTREKMGPRSKIVLLAAPNAVEYYPRIGFRHHESAWILDASAPLTGDARDER
jgi:ribosomal protein S18 acetylase RimI-like enzyme